VKLVALVLAICLSLVPAARAGSWRRPVEGPVLRPFTLSVDRFARGQHRGIDLGAPLGAAVRAACGGRVRFAGRVPGGGRTVSVGCGRLVATYQHLGDDVVRRGQMLVAGAAVGTVGRSGRPSDPRPHLHLGAREAASGRYVDPLTLLGRVPRAPPPFRFAPRRPVPLGPAPRPALRRPVPFGPAPRPALRRPVLRPAAPVRLAPVPRGTPAPERPLVVWIGLALVGLGLPLGGLVVRRRRRAAPGWRAGEEVGLGA
jgi:murein DD-endopeptidase MepM/ murein hydrolase activator NlpD